jgi:hypothetical protein
MCTKGAAETIEAPRETGPVTKGNTTRFPLMTILFGNFLSPYDTTSILKYTVGNSVT